MSRSARELLDLLPADPAPSWPVVPPAPVPPPALWEPVHLEGDGSVIWRRDLAPGEDKIAAWLGLRAVYARTGMWPLIVDDRFSETVFGPSVGEVVPSDTRAWIRHVLLDDTYDVVIDQLDRSDPVPLSRPAPDPAIASLQDAPGDRLALVPARAWWVVPQVLGWGGAVNQDVNGPEHTAMLGRWAGLYGAELTGLTLDVMTLAIHRPPQTGQDALVAGLESFAYCQDSVFQGVESLDALAPMMSSSAWFFWWD